MPKGNKTKDIENWFSVGSMPLEDMGVTRQKRKYCNGSVPEGQWMLKDHGVMHEALSANVKSSNKYPLKETAGWVEGKWSIGAGKCLLVK